MVRECARYVGEQQLASPLRTRYWLGGGGIAQSQARRSILLNIVVVSDLSLSLGLCSKMFNISSHQITWIESLFKEIGFNISNFALCGDNQGAIFLAMNPVVESRSKHIDIKYHHIRECVIEKRVVLHYVPTVEQVADIMTKCLSYDKFKKFRNLLGIMIP